LRERHGGGIKASHGGGVKAGARVALAKAVMGLAVGGRGGRRRSDSTCDARCRRLDARCEMQAVRCKTMGSSGQYAAMVPTAPSATTFTGHLAHWAASVVGRKVGVCARGEEWEVRPRTSAFADASSTPCRAPLQVLHPLGYLLGVPVSLKPSLVVIKVQGCQHQVPTRRRSSSQEGAQRADRSAESLSTPPSAYGS